MESIENAGANYIKAADLHTTASNTEEFLRTDPDVILLERSGTGDFLDPGEVFRRPEWQSMRAVRQRRVYLMPDLPGFITPMEERIRLQWLVEVLHPDQFAPRSRAEAHDT